MMIKAARLFVLGNGTLAIMLAALILVSAPYDEVYAQQPKSKPPSSKAGAAPEKAKPVTVQKHDTRGKGEPAGVFASLSASDKGVVVVLVRSNDDKIIKTAEDTLKGLIRDGYERVGMILGDKKTDEADEFWVFSKGFRKSRIVDIEDSYDTRLTLYKAVAEEYNKDVKPLLNSRTSP
jgi:hypothetical protein